MQIQTNMAAKNVSRNQKSTGRAMNSSLQKLCTGYRINHAGDNAAGLAISEEMRSQIHGLDQAMKNTDDGISMSNVGEGALAQVQSMVHRLQTLATQAANATYATLERENLSIEKDQILDEIDRIASATDYSDVPLFTRLPNPEPEGYVAPTSESEISLQIGHSSEETMEVQRFYMDSRALGLDEMSFDTVKDGNEAINMLDDAVTALTSMRSSLGATATHLGHTQNSLHVTKNNMEIAEGAIRDTDYADEVTNFTAKNVINQAANSVMLHANAQPEIVLKLLQ